MSEKAKSGERQKAVLAKILEQKVGDTLLLVPSRIHEMAEECGARFTDLYRIFQKLANQGHFQCERNKAKEGIRLVFGAGREQTQKGLTLDISQLPEKIDYQLAKIQKKIDRLTAELATENEQREKLLQLRNSLSTISSLLQ